MSARIHVEHISVNSFSQNLFLLKVHEPVHHVSSSGFEVPETPTRDFYNNNISIENLAAGALRSRAFLSSRSKSVEYTTVVYAPYVFFHHSAVLGPEHNIRGNP